MLYLDQLGAQLNLRHIPPQEGEAAPPGANACAGGPQQAIEALSPANLRTSAQGGPGENKPPPAGIQHLRNPLLAQGGPPLAPGENMAPPAGAQQPPYYPAWTMAVDCNAQEGTTQFGTILQRNFAEMAIGDDGYWWRKRMTEVGFASSNQVEWRLDRIPFNPSSP